MSVPKHIYIVYIDTKYTLISIFLYILRLLISERLLTP